ncbi:hypothetical protein FRC00_007045 [Tulasnella sp. 408]|nr:hypothetical protein FRC00_007045 [Tulasnella sp. 408]
MSPISRVHRQLLGALLSTFLIVLTLLLPTGYTGSNGTSATGIFSLVLLLASTIARYVVETVFSLRFALLQVYWCTIVGHGTFISWSLVKLVELYTSTCVRARTYIVEIPKTVNLAVELLIFKLFSAYFDAGARCLSLSTKVKSRPSEKGLLTPEGHLSSSPPEPFDCSSFSTTPDCTLSKAAVVPANADPTAATLGSSKPSPGSQGDVLLTPSPIGTAALNDSPLGKSSPEIPTKTAPIPKRTRKIALKRFDFANLVRLRGPVVAAVAPRSGRSPLPRIVIHKDISDSSITSSVIPIFTTTAAASARTPSAKPASLNRYSPDLDLQFDFESETTGHPEPSTHGSGTPPSIIISPDAQHSLRSASYPLSATTIAASFAHSTPPTFHTATLTSRSNSTLGADSDLEWEAAADPTGSNGRFLTPPQTFTVNGKFPGLATSYSYSNASSTASLFGFSRSTSTLPTPATTPCSTPIDLQSDLEREADVENHISTPDTATAIELPTSDSQDVNQVTAGNPEEEVHVVDHRREFDGRTTLFEFDEEDEVPEINRRCQAKGESKLLEGGGRIWRRPDSRLAMPTLAPLVASQTEDDDFDDEGSKKGDLERAILMSLGLPVDPTPLDGTSPDPVIDPQGRSFNRGIIIHTPATPPRLVVSETGDNELNDHGFSRAELARVIAESRQGAASFGVANPPDEGRPASPSVSTTSTLVETDDEEDGVDDKGFSKKDQRKAMVESRDAARERPFYGASTSNAGNQPLSQEEWDVLERYVAAPSIPRKVVRLPSPASTHVDAEIELSSLPPSPLPFEAAAPIEATTHVDTELVVPPPSLPPPSPLPEATAPVKTKRLPHLRKFVKKINPSKPVQKSEPSRSSLNGKEN